MPILTFGGVYLKEMRTVWYLEVTVQQKYVQTYMYRWLFDKTMPILTLEVYI